MTTKSETTSLRLRPPTRVEKDLALAIFSTTAVIIGGQLSGLFGFIHRYYLDVGFIHRYYLDAGGSHELDALFPALFAILLAVLWYALRRHHDFRKEMLSRQQVTDALNRSDMMLRAVFDGAIDGILAADTDTGKFVTANEAICRMLGYRRDEMLELSVKDIHPSEELLRVFEVFERQMTGELSLATDIPMKRKDGTVFMADINTTAAELNGRICAIGVFRDITERKRAEEAVAKSEERFRSMVETSSDWVWETDANGVYTYSSPKVENILGFSPNELLGRTPFDLMPPEEADRVGALFGEIVKSRKPFDRLENTNQHKDGRHVVLETSGVPILDHAGNFVGFRGIDRDITERKNAEETLRESEGKYRTMVDYTYNWEYWISSQNRILYMSPSCERITGYSREEFLADADLLKRIIHPDDAAKYAGHRHLAPGLAEASPAVAEIEFRIITRSGEVIWIRHLCRSIHDTAGNYRGIRVSNQDVTKRPKPRMRSNSLMVNSKSRFRSGQANCKLPTRNCAARTPNSMSLRMWPATTYRSR